MVTLKSLSKDVEKIKARNKNVELDKAWETSTFRKALLILFTYCSIGLYMYAIGVPEPMLNAVIPSMGFLLSTLSLPFFKKYWINRIMK